MLSGKCEQFFSWAFIWRGVRRFWAIRARHSASEWEGPPFRSADQVPDRPVIARGESRHRFDFGDECGCYKCQ